MKMIAKAIEGKEFMYNRNTAHKVSDRGAAAICAALNERRYQLKDGEIWHIYDCGAYETEYTSAGYLSFTRHNGYLYEKRA